MIKIISKKVAWVGVLLCAFQAQAMQQPSVVPPNLDIPENLVSLSLGANFTVGNNKKIEQAVTPGLTAAQSYIGGLIKGNHVKSDYWNFTPQMKRPQTGNNPKNFNEADYHMTLAMVEHANSTDTVKIPFGKSYVECLGDMWNDDIKNPMNQINLFPYSGIFSATHMYVTGYNSQQQQDTQHYEIISKYNNYKGNDKINKLDKLSMTSDLKNKFPFGILSVHYVLAYDAVELNSQNLPRANIITQVNLLMNDIAKTQKKGSKCPMKDFYGNKNTGFVPHITIGAIRPSIKSVQGTFPLPTIPLDQYDYFVEVYDMILNENQGAPTEGFSTISFDTYVFRTMDKDGKRPKINLVLK